MPDPLKIIEFRAENTKRLKAVTIRPDPEHPVVVLTGKNRQGKSSIIDAIWMALGGKSSIPGKPIRAGETEAVATLDLGEFIVERRITDKGAYLNVTTKEGFKAPSAQNFLNSRLGEHAHNPLEFMRLSPAEQVTALQGMVDLKLDLKEFEEVSGLPTQGIQASHADPVTLLDHAYKHLFDQRGEINREVKRLEATLKSMKAEIPPGREEQQPVSVQELFTERQALEAKKVSNDKQREAVGRDDAKLADMEKLCEEIHKERMEIQARLAKLEEQYNQLHEEYRQMEGELVISRTAIEQLTDPDFSEIDARIAAADETNRIANLVKSCTDSSADLEAVSAQSMDLTSRLAGIKDLKGRLIAEAGLPVPGLGFENGQVTYNNLPLSQASGREQIEISCAICMARHPAIGILTIDIGWSELDSEGKEIIRKWAEQVGAQIWVTRVTDDMQEGGFYIEDGELTAIDGQPVETSAGNGGEKKTARGKKAKPAAYPRQPSEPEKPSWMF